ncbi:MAG: hypothetical protein KJ044_03275, partial [Planctomycetes bacterium]|nr:hypothetical protein [Planctomycetota bacterium]
YWVGVLAAIPTALVLKKGILRSRVTPFLMEMPSYKLPRPRNIARVLYERGGSFVKRAGTIILAVSIIVWAALWFPRSDDITRAHEQRREAARAGHAATLAAAAEAWRQGMTGPELEADPAVAAALADMRELEATDKAARDRDEPAAQPMNHRCWNCAGAIVVPCLRPCRCWRPNRNLRKAWPRLTTTRLRPMPKTVGLDAPGM